MTINVLQNAIVIDYDPIFSPMHSLISEYSFVVKKDNVKHCDCTIEIRRNEIAQYQP